MSLGYQLASIVAGGLAPLIATYLLGVSGNGWLIAAYVAAAGVVSVVAVASYSETRHRDLAADDGLRSGGGARQKELAG